MQFTIIIIKHEDLKFKGKFLDFTGKKKKKILRVTAGEKRTTMMEIL